MSSMYTIWVHRKSLTKSLTRWSSLFGFFLLTITCGPTSVLAAAHERPSMEMFTQDIVALCRDGDGSPNPVSVDERSAACLGYIKGVVDALQDAGASGTCAVNLAVADVLETLRTGRVGYEPEDDRKANKLVARLFLRSCEGGWRK